MSASGLHTILDEGDDNTWKKFTEHSHSFLFAAVADQTQVVSLHELEWDRRKPRPFPSGALGWVTCHQNAGAGEPLSLHYNCRVHVCRQWPCTAVWPPSKYGDVPPPARHGKIVRLCDAGECVPIDAAWKSLLEDIGRGGAGTQGVSPSLDAPLASTLVDAMSGPTPAVAEGAAAGSQGQVLQDEVISAANVVGARAETEQGTTAVLDAPVPGTLLGAVSKPTSAVAETASTSGSLTQSSRAEACRIRILARADEISVAGAWIGVLEIMAFCAMHKQRVVVQLEEGTLDPIADLAPALQDKTWSRQPLAGRMVLCRLRGGGVWHTASWETCSHYVAAQPLQGELPLRGVGVVAHMARLGYGTIMTEANGDCGIESLLVLANSRRGPSQRIALRRRLQEFMQAVASSPVWHDAYIAAGEVLPEKHTVVLPLSNDLKPMQPQADIRDGGALTLADGSMTLVESIQPCNPCASAAEAIVMPDGANQEFQAAILWAVGLDKPTDGFLRRIAASLTGDEAKQLVQAHIRDRGVIVQHRPKKPSTTAWHWK